MRLFRDETKPLKHRFKPLSRSDVPSYQVTRVKFSCLLTSKIDRNNNATRKREKEKLDVISLGTAFLQP